MRRILEPSSLSDPAAAASVDEIDEQILEMFVRRIGAAAGLEPGRESLTPSASTVAQLREVVELLTRRERARHRLTRRSGSRW